MHRIKWKYKHDNPNVWDSVKAVLREWFIGIQAYLKKQERKKKNSITLHLCLLQKKKWRTPKLVEGKTSWKSEWNKWKRNKGDYSKYHQN